MEAENTLPLLNILLMCFTTTEYIINVRTLNITQSLKVIVFFNNTGQIAAPVFRKARVFF